MRAASPSTVGLYWVPLGAGGLCVALNGRVFEAIDAAHRRRPRCAPYHAALIVTHDGEPSMIELCTRVGREGGEARRRPYRRRRKPAARAVPIVVVPRGAQVSLEALVARSDVRTAIPAAR